MNDLDKIDMEPVAEVGWLGRVDRVIKKGMPGGTLLYSADQVVSIMADASKWKALAASRGADLTEAIDLSETLMAENERLSQGWHDANANALRNGLERGELFTTLLRIYEGAPCSMDELSTLIAKHHKEQS